MHFIYIFKNPVCCETYGILFFIVKIAVNYTYSLNGYLFESSLLNADF